LLVGNEGANITETHDEERDGLWIDVEVVVVHPIFVVIARTCKKIHCHPQLWEENPGKSDSKLQALSKR